MKRSAALAALSRDHHQALVIAQRLRRAEPPSAVAARSSFLDYWTRHGRVHFRLEEDVLLPTFANYGDARDPVVLQVLGDHVMIRCLADRLARETPPDVDVLHELGVQLADHIRLEERQLFVLIEQLMPADQLMALAEALEQAERLAGGYGSDRDATRMDGLGRDAPTGGRSATNKGWVE